jgi:nucleotide-binding universal stress UspA family protein
MIISDDRSSEVNMMAVSQMISRTPIKIGKIAVLTDFSRTAESALRYAAMFARGYHADLVLAHAYIFPGTAFAAPEISLAYEAMDELQRNIEKRLVAETKSPFLSDLQCSTLLRVGGSKDLLEDLKDADLVVVGTAGDAGLEKTAFGSTAETIFRSSTAPVLTVGPHCQCDNVSSFKTVLYATDFSTGAATALPYAVSIAEKYEAKLVMLHVVGDKDLPFSFDRAMASQEPLEKLQALVSEYDTTCVVGFGDPENAILEEAKNRKADVIVSGARGAGRFATVLSHFGGGTAYHIAANAACPVLTVR